MRTLMILGLLGGLTMAASADATYPLKWFGVDDAGSPMRLHEHPRATEMMREFGFNLGVIHYIPIASIADSAAHIRETDEWCRANDVRWVSNLEWSAWLKTTIDEKGRDWINAPDGRHFFQFPDELMAELGRCSNLLGLMHDEPEHAQNSRHKVAGTDQPWIFDPEGFTLEGAADGMTASAEEIAREHNEYGLKLYTEHVFPVMFHPLARGGWIAGTKILKENWSPAYIACAMGAALQYDTPLWITPDLWGMPGYPGHSVDEYRSSLLLAYHMGADCIYTENLSYDHENAGKGSLIHLVDGDWTVTEYGEVTKWFAHEYMPANPREYSFRQLRPRVAIVRQPDACWGQSLSWLPDMLFGHKEWKSTPVTEAWLGLWHVLSRGVISQHALSWHNAKLAPRAYQVLCPLDGVVVFDHHVGEELLQNAEVICLTGIGVSQETLVAIDRCVKRGATCVALPHLLPARVREMVGEKGSCGDGKGKWVATTDFTAPEVLPHIEHVIPQDDVLRYQFGDRTVTFRPTNGDSNRISVEVVAGDQIP